MPELPSGMITFLLTDIEGSTRLWERHPVETRAALVHHDQLIEQLVSDHHGSVIRPRGEGDSRFAVFQAAADGVAAACAIQRAFMSEVWPTPQPMRVRIALHTGSAELIEGDYYGSDVNRCARLRAVAHGGQTLLSGRTADESSTALPVGVTLQGLGQHRLKDLGQPERIYQLLHPDLLAEFPPLKSLSSLLNNLPYQATSFVGRERELAEVRTLVGRTRLLTLTGAGGAGKTRLALHAAADVLDDFDDGAWFVDLAPLASDGPLVVQTLASVLNVREESGRLLLDSVIDFLRPKQALLLLDNCEHLVTASAELSETILRTCPHARMLATSREALGVPGETAWRVPSLSLPGEGDRLLSPQLLERSEALRLFQDRAAAVQPGFALNERNLPAVVQVCRRLDGMPLAIELAAARVRVLSPEQIASRLADRFRLLSSGSRTAASRQQTLRALVDWSYELLSNSERMLFARLAAFAGGLDLEAAETVCSGGPVDTEAILDLVTQLVDKSLVIAESESDKTMRFRLLETLRQYGQERLREFGELEITSSRHAAHYMQFAERAEPELTGPDQAVWLGRLEREHDNLRASLAWSSDADESETGLRIGGALWRFWSMRGYLSEGREHLGRALAAPIQAAQHTASLIARRIRPKALIGAGVLAWQQGDYDRARTFLEASIALGDELQDVVLAEALKWLGNTFVVTGHPGDALEQYRRSQAVYERAGDLSGVVDARSNLGIVYRRMGQWDAALGEFAACLALRERMAHRWGVASSNNNLGEVHRSRGEPRQAIPYYERAIALWESIGDSLDVALGLTGLGIAQVEAGDVALGRATLLEAEARVAALGNTSYLADLYRFLACAELAVGDLQSALRYAERSLELGHAGGARAQEGMTERVLGQIALAAGDPASACEHLLASRSILTGAGETGELARTEDALSSLPPGDLDAAEYSVDVQSTDAPAGSVAWRRTGGDGRRWGHK